MIFITVLRSDIISLLYQEDLSCYKELLSLQFQELISEFLPVETHVLKNYTCYRLTLYTLTVYNRHMNK